VAPRLAIVVGDGLSAAAIHAHAVPLLREVRPLVEAAGFAIAPIVLAQQARVALGDEVGERLGAQAVAVLIGERPGLSSPDSLGVYLTWQPKRGRSDAERNCISNIRDEGLGYVAAARQLAWLLEAARRLGATGVALKDERDAAPLSMNEREPAVPAPPASDEKGTAA
jgi:ethanolamine ammonia-lyase small subunit